MDLEKSKICMLYAAVLCFVLFARVMVFSAPADPVTVEKIDESGEGARYTLLSFTATSYLGLNLGLEKRFMRQIGGRLEAGVSPLFNRPSMCITGALLGMIYANPDDFFQVNVIFGLLDYLHYLPGGKFKTGIQLNSGAGLMFRLNWSGRLSTDLSFGLGYFAMLTGKLGEAKLPGKGIKGPGLSLRAGVNYRIF